MLFITSIRNKKINSVSLDYIRKRTMAVEDPELFLRTHDVPLIIDEFQYAPNFLSYIKIRIDEARKNELFEAGKKIGTLYYLTGSQVFETMEDVSESLAGRIGIINLHPLLTRELNGVLEEEFIPDIEILKNKQLVKKESSKKIFQRIFKGSYPELYKNPKIDIEMFYSSYLRTYIERDVRKIINVQNESKFIKFISSVTARTGEEYNASDIAEDVGVDNQTVDKWISVLINTYIIFLLQSHINNNVGRVVKRPKIYFMDTGLACF